MRILTNTHQLPTKIKKSTKRKIKIGIVCSSSLGGSGVIGSELAKYLAKNDKYRIVYIGFDPPFV